MKQIWESPQAALSSRTVLAHSLGHRAWNLQSLPPRLSRPRGKGAKPGRMFTPALTGTLDKLLPSRGFPNGAGTGAAAPPARRPPGPVLFGPRGQVAVGLKPKKGAWGVPAPISHPAHMPPGEGWTVVSGTITLNLGRAAGRCSPQVSRPWAQRPGVSSCSLRVDWGLRPGPCRWPGSSDAHWATVARAVPSARVYPTQRRGCASQCFWSPRVSSGRPTLAPSTGRAGSGRGAVQPGCGRCEAAVGGRHRQGGRGAASQNSLDPALNARSWDRGPPICQWRPRPQHPSHETDPGWGARARRVGGQMSGEGRAGWGGVGWGSASEPTASPAASPPPHQRPPSSSPHPRRPRGPFPHLFAQPIVSPAATGSVLSPRGLELPVRPCSWGGPRAPRPPQAPLSFPSAPRSPPVSIAPPEAAVSSHSQ